MTLHLTPEMLVACYEFLRTTPPYSLLKLPHADEVEFRVLNTDRFYAEHTVVGEQQVISLCAPNIGHTRTLVTAMAHEMIHLWQSLRGHRDVHGRSFKRIATRVCQYHGFDPKAF